MGEKEIETPEPDMSFSRGPLESFSKGPMEESSLRREKEREARSHERRSEDRGESQAAARLNETAQTTDRVVSSLSDFAADLAARASAALQAVQSSQSQQIGMQASAGEAAQTVAPALAAQAGPNVAAQTPVAPVAIQPAARAETGNQRAAPEERRAQEGQSATTAQVSTQQSQEVRVPETAENQRSAASQSAQAETAGVHVPQTSQPVTTPASAQPNAPAAEASRTSGSIPSGVSALSQGVSAIDAMSSATESSLPPAQEAFHPNRVNESAFWIDNQSPRPIIDSRSDANFRGFLEGQRQSYSGSGQEQARWVTQHSLDLESSGIHATTGQNNSFTLTNTNFNPSFTHGVLSGSGAQEFLRGERPSVSGENQATASWISSNAARLREQGIGSDVQGNRFTLTNQRLASQQVDRNVLDGSGISSQQSGSFLSGSSRVLEGNDMAQARWISQHQQELEHGGVNATVDTNDQGQPTGRFTLQNARMLPPNISPGAAAGLNRALTSARTSMQLADQAVRDGERLRSSGDAHGAQQAQDLARQEATLGLGAAVPASTIISASRAIYARRSEIERLPQPERTRQASLMERADSFMRRSTTESSEEARTDDIGRAAFLLQTAQTELDLRRAGNYLPQQQRAELNGFMADSDRLFQSANPGDLSRATFMLNQTRSLLGLELQREGVRTEFEARRHAEINVDVERMPQFQSNGRFDVSLFQRLSGVSIQDYRNGTSQTRAGLATVLGHIYQDSMSHYDTAIDGLRGLITSAGHGPVEPRLATERLASVSEAQAVASAAFVSALPFASVIDSARRVDNFISSLPSERDIAAIGIGPAGRRDLLDARSETVGAARRERGHLGSFFFDLISAERSPEEQRAPLGDHAQSSMRQAAAEDRRMILAGSRYSSMYTLTRETANHINTLARTGERALDYAHTLLGDSRAELEGIQHRIRTDPSAITPFFLRAMTDPGLLELFPHHEALTETVHALGEQAIRSLYNENTPPGQLATAAAGLLERDTGILRSAGVSTALEQLRDNPQSLTIEQRRGLILDIMTQASGGGLEVSSLAIRTGMRERFANAFAERIDIVLQRTQEMQDLGMSVQNDAHTALANLRPSQIALVRHDGGHSLEFEDPRVRDAYHGLVGTLANAGRVPEEVSRILPGLANHLEYSSDILAAQVAAGNNAIQEHIDESDRRFRTMIVGGAVGVGLAGAAIALSGGLAAFTIPELLGAIGGGIGVGTGVPGTAFSYQDYDVARATYDGDPRNPENERAYLNARANLIISSASLATSFVGLAAAGAAPGLAARNWFSAARFAAGTEFAMNAVNIPLSLGAGSLAVQDLRQDHPSDSRMDYLNIGLAGLGMAGSYFGMRGGLGRFEAIGRAAQAPHTIANISAADVTNLQEAQNLLQGGAAGHMDVDRLAEIRESAERISTRSEIGMEVTPEQRRALAAYDNLISQHASSDLAAIQSFNRHMEGFNATPSQEMMSNAAAARGRLEAISSLRSLNPDELMEMARFDQTFPAQQTGLSRRELATALERINAGGEQSAEGRFRDQAATDLVLAAEQMRRQGGEYHGDASGSMRTAAQGLAANPEFISATEALSNPSSSAAQRSQARVSQMNLALRAARNLPEVATYVEPAQVPASSSGPFGGTHSEISLPQPRGSQEGLRSIEINQELSQARSELEAAFNRSRMTPSERLGQREAGSRAADAAVAAEQTIAAQHRGATFEGSLPEALRPASASLSGNPDFIRATETLRDPLASAAQRAAGRDTQMQLAMEEIGRAGAVQAQPAGIADLARSISLEDPQQYSRFSRAATDLARDFLHGDTSAYSQLPPEAQQGIRDITRLPGFSQAAQRSAADFSLYYSANIESGVSGITRLRLDQALRRMHSGFSR